jgi:nitrogen fixation/metabolism regulation signal transduction histidine kinase
VVSLPANPLAHSVVMRSALLFAVGACTFLLAIALIRNLRRALTQSSDLDSGSALTAQSAPVHLYHNVIQELKQQKHALQMQNLAEQHRARTSENFSQTVLANLSSGVLVFAPNGLLKQANPAAKDILGFRSLQGMSPEDIFRGAEVCAPEPAGFFSDGLESLPPLVSEEIQAVLREGGSRRQMEAEYATPGEQKLHLALTISPVPSGDGGLLGVACLISDRSDVELSRRQQQMQSEISAEMALQLRTSLTAIANYAQKLADHREPDLAQQLAADIAGEAASLDRRIGGFLAQKSSAAGAGGRAS